MKSYTPQAYERTSRSLLSRIRDYTAAGTILLGSTVAAFAQEPAPVEKQDKVQSQEKKSKPEPSKLEVTGATQYDPAQNIKDSFGVRDTTSSGDSKTNLLRIGGNYANSQLPLGMSLEYDSFSSRNPDIDPVIGENGILTPDDVLKPGDFYDASTKLKASGFITRLDGYGASLWINSQRSTYDARMNGFITLTDPGDDPQVTVSEDAARKVVQRLTAFRAQYQAKQFAVYAGLFSLKNTDNFDDATTQTLTGSFSGTFTDTQSIHNLLKARGYLIGGQYQPLESILTGAEVWIVNGTLENQSASDIGGTPTSSSFKNDAGYVQFLASGTAAPLPWFMSGVEVGYRSGKDSNFDGTDAKGGFVGALDVILSAGKWNFAPMAGKDPFGNTFFGGNITMGMDRIALENLGKLWRSTSAYQDPTVTEGQRFMAIVDGVERLAHDSGGSFLIGGYGRKVNDAGTMRTMTDLHIAAGFGYGIMAQIYGQTDNFADGPIRLGGQLIWTLDQLFGIPGYVLGGEELDYATGQKTRLSPIIGAGALLRF
jgi:hypothetical protein